MERRIRCLIVVGVAFSLLTACGGRDGREPRPVPASSPAGATTTPASSSSRPVDPNADLGQTVVITDQGFEPAWLLAMPAVPIVWVNHTASAVAIAFDHQDVRSGPIPPGGSFSWTTPTPISITYHDVADPSVGGAVQVQTV